MSKDNYSEDDILKSPWVSWGKVGDKIYGTLIRVSDKKQTNQYTKKEEISRTYEIKCSGGSYHRMDDKKNPIEPAIEIRSGEIYNVGDHFSIHKIIKNIKLGQDLKITFLEEQPSKTKGNANSKIRQVLSKGIMDEEWLKEQEDAMALKANDDEL